MKPEIIMVSLTDAVSKMDIDGGNPGSTVLSKMYLVLQGVRFPHLRLRYIRIQSVAFPV